MGQRKSPVADGAGFNTLGGFGLPLPTANISRSRFYVKPELPRFDVRLSLEIDCAVVGMENSHGIMRLFWRLRKAYLELQIPGGGR